MLKRKIKLTYRDYANLQDDKRYELIEGELYMVPSPGFYHQSVLVNLLNFLTNFIKKKQLVIVLCAPMHVILTEDDVVQPDILFISNENRGNNYRAEHKRRSRLSSGNSLSGNS